jgi:spore germination protein GerM
MRPERPSAYRRKKKRRTPPVVKFIFILVVITAFGFFVFYSIDNPEFYEGIKGKVISAYDDLKERDYNSSSSPENSSYSDNKKEQLSQENIETADENFQASNDISPDTIESPSKFFVFFQKIKNFLIKEDTKENVGTYPASLTINFYFCTLGEESKFVSEERTINAGSAETAVLNAARELLKGPAQPHHFPVIPGGTKLLSVEIYQNLAKINLSQDFLENSLESSILDEYVIYTIVNTVTEIPGIDGVIFYIEGKRIRVYGSVDLTIPAIRDEQYLEEEEARDSEQ